MNLRQFGDWALKQGKVANPAPNNGYLGQCVSLIQQYLKLVYGLEFKARGNAKDWEYNIPVGFKKLAATTKLQRGDILVYGGNYGGGYGHIGFIDANWKFFDQNGIKEKAVAYRDTPFINYRCILRPVNGVECGDNMIKNNNSTSFTVRVDKDQAAVRSQPNSKSALVGTQILKRGDTFQAVAVVIGENVNGNNIWFKSQKGNYVWSGGLTRI